VLINCDLYHKSEVVKEISRLPGISESAELDAIYDNLVKLNPVTVEELKEIIDGPLKKNPLYQVYRYSRSNKCMICGISSRRTFLLVYYLS